jgi:MobA/MobL family
MSWYHLSVKAVSRSAGRSSTAAAAYRLGVRIEDRQLGLTFDYRARSGVEAAFTVAPEHAPAWAHDPERLWNAAEAAETRKNSTLAREYEIALPAYVTPEARRQIVEDFARHLVERYGVAVSAAIHAPGKDGDQRNFHAHVLTTTRRMEADGLGAKTRILDDRKTGSEEVKHLREHAANLINAELVRIGSDERVDHRSFAARGIDQEPTTHLGPSATEMERRGEGSDRGDINREIKARNEKMEDLGRQLIEAGREIEAEKVRLLEPPVTARAAQERLQDEIAPHREDLHARGHVEDIRQDGLTWWQRSASQVHQRIRWFREHAQHAWDYARDGWRSYVRGRDHELRDREQDLDHER